MKWILDASALLCHLHGEPGMEKVGPLLPMAAISTVNWSEVLQKVLVKNPSATRLRSDLEEIGLQIVPFSAIQAYIAAALLPSTKPYGLSLGDRACLSLGIDLGLPVLTADTSWDGLDLPIKIQQVRLKTRRAIR